MRYVGILTLAMIAAGCISGLAQNVPANASASDYRKLTCAELAQEVAHSQGRAFRFRA
jgi:hypothetical protein